MRMKTKIGFLTAALTLGAAALPSFAQQQGDAGGTPPADNGGGGGGRNNNNGGGGGGGGGGGPQAWRQRMQDRFKQELGVSDEEMQALQPKIDQVMQLRRDSGGFGGGGRPGRGGPGGGPGGGGGGPQSDVQQKIADLQAAIDNKDAKPEEIKSKLDALRAAKVKAHEDLVKAQADLRGLLTQRQEAVLVMRGLLD